MVAPFPQFCAALLATPQLREADPELYARVEQSQQAGGVTGNGAIPVMPPVGGGGVPQVGTAAADSARQPPAQGQQQQQPMSQPAPPEANSQGSSRFLNLQPADNVTRGVSGVEVDAPAAAVPPTARNAKDAGPAGRQGPGPGAAGGGQEPAASSAAPSSGKVAGREFIAGAGGGLASVASATAASAAIQVAPPSNTSLSGKDGDSSYCKRSLPFLDSWVKS
jgi:CCR4-NOT transcription complex subunit 1